MTTQNDRTNDMTRKEETFRDAFVALDKGFVELEKIDAMIERLQQSLSQDVVEVVE
jgi:hypothetical protein